MAATEDPYRTEAPPPKSELELAIEAAAARVDALHQKSQQSFLTKGEHYWITRQLEDARREHRDLVHRAKMLALAAEHERLQSLSQGATNYGPGAWQQIIGIGRALHVATAWNQELARQAGHLRHNLRYQLHTLHRVAADASLRSCADCVRLALDPTAVPCARHARLP